MGLLESLWTFALTMVPTSHQILLYAPISFVLGIIILYGAGVLNLKGIKTGYTRKIVHFSIFGTVSVLQILEGLPAVVVFGLVVGSIIAYGIYKGNGNAVYESIAREADDPDRTRFIVIPFLATVVGGLGANFFFGNYAIFGYLVGGIGDAMGEPVGTLFGKNKLSFPKDTKKTVEGTLGVFVGSAVAMLVGLYLLDVELGILLFLVFAVVFTSIEVFSPRGIDNFFMQFIPSLLFFLVI